MRIRLNCYEVFEVVKIEEEIYIKKNQQHVSEIILSRRIQNHCQSPSYVSFSHVSFC